MASATAAGASPAGGGARSTGASPAGAHPRELTVLASANAQMVDAIMSEFKELKMLSDLSDKRRDLDATYQSNAAAAGRSPQARAPPIAAPPAHASPAKATIVLSPPSPSGQSATTVATVPATPASVTRARVSLGFGHSQAAHALVAAANATAVHPLPTAGGMLPSADSPKPLSSSAAPGLSSPTPRRAPPAVPRSSAVFPAGTVDALLTHRQYGGASASNTAVRIDGTSPAAVAASGAGGGTGGKVAFPATGPRQSVVYGASPVTQQGTGRRASVVMSPYTSVMVPAAPPSPVQYQQPASAARSVAPSGASSPVPFVVRSHATLLPATPTAGSGVGGFGGSSSSSGVVPYGTSPAAAAAAAGGSPYTGIAGSGGGAATTFDSPATVIRSSDINAWALFTAAKTAHARQKELLARGADPVAATLASTIQAATAAAAAATNAALAVGGSGGADASVGQSLVDAADAATAPGGGSSLAGATRAYMQRGTPVSAVVAKPGQMPVAVEYHHHHHHYLPVPTGASSALSESTAAVASVPPSVATMLSHAAKLMQSKAATAAAVAAAQQQHSYRTTPATQLSPAARAGLDAAHAWAAQTIAAGQQGAASLTPGAAAGTGSPHADHAAPHPGSPAAAAALRRSSPPSHPSPLARLSGHQHHHLGGSGSLGASHGRSVYSEHPPTPLHASHHTIGGESAAGSPAGADAAPAAPSSGRRSAPPPPPPPHGYPAHPDDHHLGEGDHHLYEDDGFVGGGEEAKRSVLASAGFARSDRRAIYDFIKEASGYDIRRSFGGPAAGSGSGRRGGAGRPHIGVGAYDDEEDGGAYHDDGAAATAAAGGVGGGAYDGDHYADDHHLYDDEGGSVAGSAAGGGAAAAAPVAPSLIASDEGAKLSAPTDPPDVVMMGLLKKRARMFGVWQPRYCVLTETHVIYYGSEKAARRELDQASRDRCELVELTPVTRKGYIDLTSRDVDVRRGLPPGVAPPTGGSAVHDCFTIVNGKRTFVFACPSEASLENWVGAIAATIGVDEHEALHPGSGGSVAGGSSVHYRSPRHHQQQAAAHHPDDDHDDYFGTTASVDGGGHHHSYGDGGYYDDAASGVAPSDDGHAAAGFYQQGHGSPASGRSDPAAARRQAAATRRAAAAAGHYAR